MAKANRKQSKVARPAAPAGGGPREPRSRRARWAVVGIAAAIALAAGAAFYVATGIPSTQVSGANRGALPPASFVGSETCAGCHQAEAKLWDGSQHRLAMQHATDKTVLGDFNDASFDYYGVHSRFFRKDGKFLVETDGPDGKLAVFEVKYTFGLDPLQQYLVAFPDGRLQALSLAWDSRPKAAGGQRWFHLYPDEEIKHDDVLHWTKLNQNWNFMCAECHSTGVRKNYDAANDTLRDHLGGDQRRLRGVPRAGLASRRLGARPARAGGRSENPTIPQRAFSRASTNGATSPGRSIRGPEARNAASRPRRLRKEVETCGLCHARRGQLSEDWVPGRWLSDTHVVSSITRETYHADGQIRDVEEPYNYVPFKQSRMFAAGVTCSDCHEPHSAKLRAPGEGVCLQCHASEQIRERRASSPRRRRPGADLRVVPYAGPHLHGGRSAPRSRLPRPATRSVGQARNAECLQRLPRRQVGAMGCGGRRRLVRARPQGLPDLRSRPSMRRARTRRMPRRCSPPWRPTATRRRARASALTELAPYLSAATVRLARDRACRSRSDGADRRARHARQCAGRAALAVGVAAACPTRCAACASGRSRYWPRCRPPSQPPADRESFERAAAEFIAAQRLNADRPEGRTTLANFLARRGLPADAETEYKAALRLSPQYVTAAINLADLYRQLGRDAEGEAVLRAAIAMSPRRRGGRTMRSASHSPG